MQYTSQELKRMAQSLGADLVGVAPAQRLAGAPSGYRPSDLLPDARSVIVCGRRIPRGVLQGPVTAYQMAMDATHHRLDALALELALALDAAGAAALAIPSDEPYRHWEPERSYGRGDLSHKHAAQAAGLGRLGKNSLLITPQFGNRVHLVSVITDAELSSDPELEGDPCPPHCSACVLACPAQAIVAEERRVAQARCRPTMLQLLPKGRIVEACWACRRECPVGSRESHG